MEIDACRYVQICCRGHKLQRACNLAKKSANLGRNPNISSTAVLSTTDSSLLNHGSAEVAHTTTLLLVCTRG